MFTSMNLSLFALPISFGLIALGCFGAVDPRRASMAFGIAGDGAWVRAAGVRDIALGLFVLMVFMHARATLLGEVCACLAIVPVGDSILVYRSGARLIGIAHGLSAIVLVVYGLLLMARG